MLTRREAIVLGAGGVGGMLAALSRHAEGSQPGLPAASSQPAHGDGPSPSSQTLSLNAGWRFVRDDVRGAASSDLDDANWQPVTLPHTWNALDGQDGGADYDRGAAWYRLRLDRLPGFASLRGRVLLLRFGAASLRAEVFVNGVRLGEHLGGFSAFAFEATEAIRWDGPNLLAVRVDNTHRDDTPPWSADFTFFGGLYRGVELLALPTLHVARHPYAAPQVNVTTESLNDHLARLQVRVRLRNADAAASADARLTLELRDADGAVVSQSQSPTSVEAGTESDAAFRLEIPNPRRWHGRRDPHVYSLRVRVEAMTRDADSLAKPPIDEVTLPLGLREFRVDPGQGFLLNGETYRLYGVNRHQDREDKGWAIGPAEHDEDLRLIADMGCTALRLAHYPHDPYVYERCDRLGLVVWAEIPLIDRIESNPAFAENARQQLAEMITQLRHQPSICFWGIHNEITAPWRKGAPDPAPLVAELAALSRELDPTRPSVCAATDPIDHPANWASDLTAFNRYWGWYHDQPEGFAAWIDEMRARFPQKLLGVSEYGGGASIRHHEDPPRKPQHDGDWHPEEYQAELHEKHWAAMRERPWLWGTFVWNMFDFASDARREGDRAGRNDKGLVTFDRRVCKDAYYFYQSQWSPKPMVHLATQRFTLRRQAPVRVKAYSNCPQVELLVNERSLGSIAGEHGVFLWPAVELAPGGNRLRAVGRGRGEGVESVAEWELQG